MPLRSLAGRDPVHIEGYSSPIQDIPLDNEPLLQWVRTPVFTLLSDIERVTNTSYHPWAFRFNPSIYWCRVAIYIYTAIEGVGQGWYSSIYRH